MNYYIDTEFHEYIKDGVNTIELISIGIIDQAGRTYYAVCNEFNFDDAWNNEWLQTNVLKTLTSLNPRPDLDTQLKTFLTKKGKSKSKIAEEILTFINKPTMPDKNGVEQPVPYHPPQFYAYYADYDWVVFCWLFGTMMDLPKGFPMYCRDLQQIKDDKIDKWNEKVQNRKTMHPNLVREYNTTFKAEYINDCNFYVEDFKWHPEYPTQDNEHNALDDAIWNYKLHNFLNKL